ncbi:MAG: hypothetical protein LIP09_15805 [Bacteroidales bacterium]|nr:hypothetical protein [Bacteroidales bacterium]
MNSAAAASRSWSMLSMPMEESANSSEWALFRRAKGRIKVHTQINVVTMVPVMFRITNAKTNDVNAMDWIDYEPI